jgi:uncharacterized protein (UPF0335 family)
MSVATEFIERLTSIENEAKLLGEDRKALIDEYKEKLDMRAIMAAIRIVKIKARLGESESECETYIDEIDGKIG